LQASNPFVFKHVQHLTGSLDDSGPCVVMATPSMLQVSAGFKSCGMCCPCAHQAACCMIRPSPLRTLSLALQSGVSRELFDQWADNPRNGVIIADFAVAGTMARQVLDSPAEVLTRAGLKVQTMCDVFETA
jgi:cleavage and polyadenylation specificity factor subunit 3